MHARFMRLTLAPLLLSVLLVPTYAAAQDSEISFPPVERGTWEGLVIFSGFVSSDNVAADGSFTTMVTDVIDDTTILMDFVVADNGQVTSGQMTVDLTYFVEIVGTEEALGRLHPYRVVHDHHQTGTLKITGDADRLVAAGTLTHTTNTNTQATGSVDEVSGTVTREVEWVFHAVEATCWRVNAELVEASGISLMGTALIPRATVGEGSELYNELLVQLWAWPADLENPEGIKKAVEELNARADEIRLREFPQAEHLLELVEAWSDLQAELAQLDECQSARVDSQPQSEKSWMVGVLQEALNKALDNEDVYDASEIIDLWVAGAHESALDGDLVVKFLDAFHAKLNEAIANNDIGTITDILAFASAYGYPNLTSKAKDALP